MSVMLGERRGESGPGRGSRKGGGSDGNLKVRFSGTGGYNGREARSVRRAPGYGKVGEGRKGRGKAKGSGWREERR